MIYIFDGIDALEDDFHEKMKSLLSGERYSKIKRLRNPVGKKASAVVYLLLRAALCELYDINEAVVFDYGKNNKPRLKKYPQIHFNLSHTKNAAACIVSDAEVGIDIQSITSVQDKVAKRVLTDDEYAGFRASDEPDVYFCEKWVIKESYAKKTGEGITVDFRNIPADTIKDCFVIRGKNYFCCANVSAATGIGGKSIYQIRYIGRDDFERLHG